MFLSQEKGSSGDEGQSGSRFCPQRFGGKVELGVVCITVEIDVCVFS